MSPHYGPKIRKESLVFAYDAANVKCYAGTGTVVNNLISGIAGESVNSPTFSSNNRGFFSFATNNYLRFPNDTNLDTQTFTMEVFARTNNLTQNGFFFEKGSVNSQYSLFQEGSNIRFRLNSGGVQNVVTIASATYINTTDWFHIAATFTTGQQRVYVNGALASSGTFSGTVATNSSGMSIGAYGGYSGGKSYFYNGDISLVRVYTQALTADEVAQNYRAIRGRYI